MSGAQTFSNSWSKDGSAEQLKDEFLRSDRSQNVCLFTIKKIWVPIKPEKSFKKFTQYNWRKTSRKFKRTCCDKEKVRRGSEYLQRLPTRPFTKIEFATQAFRCLNTSRVKAASLSLFRTTATEKKPRSAVPSLKKGTRSFNRGIESEQNITVFCASRHSMWKFTTKLLTINGRCTKAWRYLLLDWMAIHKNNNPCQRGPTTGPRATRIFKAREPSQCWLLYVTIDNFN